MTHSHLVRLAEKWLRSYRCGVVLSEQACVSGEMPDAIGWKRACHSVLVECKISRADFLADRAKPWRLKPEMGVGCERFYLAPAGVIRHSAKGPEAKGEDELPAGWGLLECRARKVEMVKPAKKNLRTEKGFACEMNLLLASLRRVEIRIEPQTITDFLKWQNRMAEYNGGQAPEGVTPPAAEENLYLAERDPYPVQTTE